MSIAGKEYSSSENNQDIVVLSLYYCSFFPDQARLLRRLDNGTMPAATVLKCAALAYDAFNMVNKACEKKFVMDVFLLHMIIHGHTHVHIHDRAHARVD